MVDLDRFRQAQDASRAGFAAALGELRAGRKTGHWIWYVFPQLAGLGQSANATRYGLAGWEEAVAYLRDPVLGERLTAAASAVREQLARAHPIRLDVLMGSQVDALKLVSCMTLFAPVARHLHAAGRREFAGMAGHAEAILEIAASQGYPRCAFTEAHLRRHRPRPAAHPRSPEELA